MQLLKDRILRDGYALGNDILLVDSFINHQVDPEMMREIGMEFARIFGDKGVTKVATIAVSGVSPALMTALELGVPMLIMKKELSRILSQELLQTPVHSYTKGNDYLLTAKRCFLEPGDRVLFIDDFLANGEAAMGAVRIVESAGATLVGIGSVIEKAFQPGRKKLRTLGYEPVALARISRLDEGVIEFEEN